MIVVCKHRPPPHPPYNSPLLDHPPKSYPRFLSFLLSIILGSTWVAWVGPFFGDFGVVSGRKRKIMLPTPSRGGVGSAPLQVWPLGIFEKRRTSAAKRCFFKKTCRWVAFLPVFMFFPGRPRGRSNKTRGLQIGAPGCQRAGWVRLRTHQGMYLVRRWICPDSGREVFSGIGFQQVFREPSGTAARRPGTRPHISNRCAGSLHNRTRIHVQRGGICVSSQCLIVCEVMHKHVSI